MNKDIITDIDNFIDDEFEFACKIDSNIYGIKDFIREGIECIGNNPDEFDINEYKDYIVEKLTDIIKDDIKNHINETFKEV
ncbi:hypothetical protein [uncultured Arcobacter sp.]|uniref:hypothetical protein n=1 Tax=uncultured Arcobacter sp. TaxID=165434 RepID=UPI002620CF0F|nr:hypothetical protein [uncultured Arcobacter sp.]